MTTSHNSIFLTEINKQISELEHQSQQIKEEIARVQKDPKHYLSNLYASKKFYQLLVDKFKVALKKAKLEAIRDRKEFTFQRYIRPVYLHKIDQFIQFKRNAPVIL